MFPGRQPGLEPGPPDLRAEQFETLGLLLQPGQASQVRQRRPAPQGQRVLQLPRAVDRISRFPAPPQEPLGDLHVSAVTAEFQGVAGRPRPDHCLAAQDPAQIRHVMLQRVQRGRRRGIAPDGFHELAGADDLAAMQRQGGQHRLTPQPAHRPRLAVHHDINRPKQPHLHDACLHGVKPK